MSLERGYRPDIDHLNERTTEAKAIRAIMARRYFIGIPQPRDFDEALEKRKRDLEIVKKPEMPTLDLTRDVRRVALDWDGVCLDSMQRISMGVVEVIKKYGDPRIEVPSAEMVMRAYDAPFWEFYERFGIRAGSEAEQRQRNDYFHDVILPGVSKILKRDKDNLFPDVTETLIELREKGLRRNRDFKIGLVTAGEKERVERELERTGLRPYIDFIKAFKHNKTEALAQVCEEDEVDPRQVVFLGDLPRDNVDARKTGLPIRFVAVAGFPEAVNRLGSYDPDYMVSGVNKEIFTLRPYVDSPKIMTRGMRR